MNKNTLITILAVIGGIVVLGWALKLTFKLLGLLIVIGIGLVIYFGAQKMLGGPK
ncbi:hypothetical protein [Sphingomonas sp.]|uniref:hypothetical protein n=1 Tax=Sphingomonas sp. TaxID=28214 RepID=UPI003D6C99AE